MKFQVGQKVMVTDVNVRGPVVREVEKVGRKILTLVQDNTPYDVETGQQRNGHSFRHVYTLAEWDEISAVTTGTDRLRELGITLSKKFTSEQIKKILASLE